MLDREELLGKDVLSTLDIGFTHGVIKRLRKPKGELENLGGEFAIFFEQMVSEAILRPPTLEIARQQRLAAMFPMQISHYDFDILSGPARKRRLFQPANSIAVDFSTKGFGDTDDDEVASNDQVRTATTKTLEFLTEVSFLSESEFNDAQANINRLLVARESFWTRFVVRTNMDFGGIVGWSTFDPKPTQGLQVHAIELLDYVNVEESQVRLGIGTQDQIAVMGQRMLALSGLQQIIEDIAQIEARALDIKQYI